MQSSPVLKSLPRPQRSPIEARALVIAWQASDQSKSAWCRSQGIIRTTLQSCLVRIRVSAKAPSHGGVLWRLRWDLNSRDCRSACRYSSEPVNRGNGLSFRFSVQSTL